MTRRAYVRTRFGGERRDFELPRDADAFRVWIAERRGIAKGSATFDRHRDIVMAYLSRLPDDAGMFLTVTWADTDAPVSVEHHQVTARP
ncbi:hypothetical protein GZH49_12915 [Nocardia terpenica]|uniref:hypothetical protein n=1 Tax=Nocardia terpenica TaxID=455432 RepID=UPI002FE03076